MRDEHELVLVEQDAVDVGVTQSADEADLDLIAQDEVEHLLGMARPHGQLHARIGTPKPFKNCGDVGRQLVRTQCELPRGSASNVGREPPSFVDLRALRCAGGDPPPPRA